MTHRPFGHRLTGALLACVVAIGVSSTPEIAAAASVSHTSRLAAKGPVGWDVYRRLADLPALTSGVQTKQFSSFDRTGGNGDFSHCLTQAADGCVIAQRSGAGEVDSIWFTRDGGDVTKTGNITIQLDGKTVLHAPLQDVVNGKLGAPFITPLVANADQSSGGVTILVPMPFHRSMRIVTDNDPIYYHVTYRAFADSTGVNTFNPKDQALDVIDMFKAAGTRDPKPPVPGAKTQTHQVNLASGTSATIATEHGPGMISQVTLHLPQLASDTILHGTRLRVTADGQRTVDAPLGEFFGSGLGGYQVNALMSAVNPKTQELTAWWPMPYRARADIQLVNASGVAITGATASATAAADPSWAARLGPQGDAGYFRATSNSADTTPGADYKFLQAQGRGKFVGVSQTMQGASSRGYLEGDERVYVDGAATPQIHGTGTEDFYEGGWYFNRDVFTDPLNGESGHEPGTAGCPTAEEDCTSVYREMISDAVPFGSSLTFGIEHGGVDDEQAHYASTAFWYGNNGDAQSWTDQLDIGDRASEAAHAYHSTGTTGTVDSTFEGDDGRPAPSSHSVEASTAPVSFRLRVDPRNHGVVLRRMSDQQKPYQQADITVDGQPAGTWTEPLGNTSHRWLDDDYLLPHALTARKSNLTVTLTPTAGSPAWSAASYAAVSTVPPFRDHSAPGAVSGLRATGGETNTISLAWGRARDNVYQPSYQIYGSTDPRFTPGPSTLVGHATRNSYTQGELGLKQTWYYQVRAVDAAGNQGPLSPVASATTGLTQRVEAESLLPAVDADAPVSSQGDCCNVSWSGGAQLWFQPTAAGKHVTLAFTVDTAGLYAIAAVQTKARDYGINTVAIDGTATGPTIDAYNNPDVITTAPIDYGSHQLSAGQHTLTLTVTGKNADAIGYLAGLDYFDLTLSG